MATSNHIPNKYCSKCKQEYPATTEYFSTRGKRSGLSSRCKSCIAQVRRETYIPHPRPVEQLSEGVKRCSRCKEVKLANLEYFRAHADCKDGLHSICRECHRRQSAEYYHTEAGQESARRSRAKPERKLYMQNYRRLPYFKALRQKYSANARIHLVRRRARKKQLADNFTQLDWNRALRYFNNGCAVCGKQPDFWTRLAADHWIPLSSTDCPGTVPTNIIPLCHAIKDGVGSCNLSKSDKLPHEWLIESFGRRKAKTIMQKISNYFEWVAQQHE